MKIKTLMALAAAMGLAACVDEYKYEPVAANNNGIYLKANKAEYVLTESEEGKIEFSVHRHDSINAGTYAIKSNDEMVKLPSTVSFAAGQKSQTLEVGVEIPVGTLGKKVVISVAPDDAYLYGAQEVAFTLYRCRTVESTNTIYIIDWIEERYSSYTKTQNVCIMGNKDGVQTYMVKDMYSDGLDIKFTLNEKGDAAIESQPAYYAAIEEGSDEKRLVYVSGIGKRDMKTGVITLSTMFLIEGQGYFTMSGETIGLPID